MNNGEFDFSSDSLKTKEIIFNTLKNVLNKNQKFLNFLNLNQENFSKSLQLELHEFISMCKFNQKIFTTSEKEGIIFLPEQKKVQNSFEFNQLQIILNEIEEMKLKLKVIKEKINECAEIKKVKEDPITLNKENMNNEIVCKKIEEILDERNISEENRLEIKNEELSRLRKFKNEICELYELNEKLKEQKEKLENKMKTFFNLPSDIKRIKEMIKQKREEYDELNIT
jgi:hypothetical protein